MSASTPRESSPELARIMGAVARDLFGEPNEGLSSDDELCFGSRGSLKVNLKAGTFFDFEAGAGGGTLDLVMRERHVDKKGALAWLREHKHLADAAKMKIVARYPYTDSDGKLLYEVVRLDPKDFRQRRPDGAGGWLWKMKGVERVLYRLPSVLAAVEAGAPVYVVEGEKAADALSSLGVAATCSPGGACKWRDIYATVLAGAGVVILPDNDEPGMAHAAQVAKSLRRLASRAVSLQVLALPGLPAKGDVADWIAAGGTADELARLAAEAPEPSEEEASAAEAADSSSITEDAVAQAFTERHGGALRYCHHAQHWYVWTGSHWRREESKLAFAWAREMCRYTAQQATDKEKPKISKASFSAAVERFAQADRTFAVTASTWDRDPMLLGTPGGTVNLRTGILRPAEPADYITLQTAVAPAPRGTPHPKWTTFLDAATDTDTELQAFLQRLVGYCLTGDVTEEVLAFLYGEGWHWQGHVPRHDRRGSCRLCRLGADRGVHRRHAPQPRILPRPDGRRAPGDGIRDRSRRNLGRVANQGDDRQRGAAFRSASLRQALHVYAAVQDPSRRQSRAAAERPLQSDGAAHAHRTVQAQARAA